MKNTMDTWLDNAYLAGLVDSEGSLGLYGSQLALGVEITYESYIQILAERYGVRVYTRKPSKPHHKKSFQVTFKGDSLKQLLHDIYPYVIEKRPQVRLVMQLIAYRKSRGVVGKLTPLCRKVHRRLERKLKEEK